MLLVSPIKADWRAKSLVKKIRWDWDPPEEHVYPSTSPNSDRPAVFRSPNSPSRGIKRRILNEKKNVLTDRRCRDSLSGDAAVRQSVCAEQRVDEIHSTSARQQCHLAGHEYWRGSTGSCASTGDGSFTLHHR